MNVIWRRLRLALLVAGGAIYVWLGYLASASNHPPLLAVLVGLVPFAAGIVGVAWRSTFRLPAIAMLCAVCAAIALNLDTLLRHASWLYFLQHIGAMTALAIMFGGTLGTVEGALCSRIARIAIAEPLDDGYLRYTWKVTAAWTAYFVLCGLISAGLFILAPLAAWAFFAAVLTPASVGAMFIGEFLIRLRVLPGSPHLSIAQTIRYYREYTQHGKSAAKA
jgi:uncharacterized membrane protein